MSDFPEPGTYRISMGSYTAIVLDGQQVLSGQPVDNDTSLWDLYYVNSGNDEKMCNLASHNGSCYLTVPGLPLDGNVFLLPTPVSDPTTWILRKAEDGYTISTISDDKEYFWHLDFEGGPVAVAGKDTREVQSWQFNGPY